MHKMKTTLSPQTTLHYITVPSCMGLCTCDARLIGVFDFKTVYEIILRLEGENL